MSSTNVEGIEGVQDVVIQNIMDSLNNVPNMVKTMIEKGITEEDRSINSETNSLLQRITTLIAQIKEVEEKTNSSYQRRKKLLQHIETLKKSLNRFSELEKLDFNKNYNDELRARFNTIDDIDFYQIALQMQYAQKLSEQNKKLMLTIDSTTRSYNHFYYGGAAIKTLDDLTRTYNQLKQEQENVSYVKNNQESLQLLLKKGIQVIHDIREVLGLQEIRYKIYYIGFVDGKQVIYEDELDIDSELTQVVGQSLQQLRSTANLQEKIKQLSKQSAKNLLTNKNRLNMWNALEQSKKDANYGQLLEAFMYLAHREKQFKKLFRKENKHQLNELIKKAISQGKNTNPGYKGGDFQSLDLLEIIQAKTFTDFRTADDQTINVLHRVTLLKLSNLRSVLLEIKNVIINSKNENPMKVKKALEEAFSTGSVSKKIKQPMKKDVTEIVKSTIKI